MFLREQGEHEWFWPAGGVLDSLCALSRAVAWKEAGQEPGNTQRAARGCQWSGDSPATRSQPETARVLLRGLLRFLVRGSSARGEDGDPGLRRPPWKIFLKETSAFFLTSLRVCCIAAKGKRVGRRLPRVLRGSRLRCCCVRGSSDRSS
ncbi:hypothetical protein Q5P01_014573 [Channa striata]|uniref:Uncharacterized protein n=1 Tax=Channa striata TaxID=64152 RepID=A0AA88MFU9_CHASR|nr:hypothetical protein Q5P01_014573 [Channa striata]